MDYTSTFMKAPETVYTSLAYLALLFDWSITLTVTLTVTIFDNIILEQSAGSKSGVYVCSCEGTRDRVHFIFVPGSFV